MKKIFLAILAITFLSCSAFTDDDEFGLGVWFDYPEGITRQNIEGIGIGLPVISCNDLEGT